MKNSETEAIKLNIREQTKILNDVRNTKAYKAVEGYHFLKGQKGIGKIQKTGEVLKHICCKADKRIQSQDPLEAVLKMQAEGEEQINSLGVELTEYQGCMQILSKILEVKNTERKVICVFAPYEMMDQPDGYARRIKNIDDLLGERMLRIYIAKSSVVNAVLPECSEKSGNYISIRYNDLKKQHCDFVTIIAHLVGSVYIHSVYQAMLSVAQDRNIIKLYDFHGVVPEELAFMGMEKEAEYYSKQEAELINNSNYIIIANQAMKEHILSKYPGCKSEFILMPMNNDDNNLDLMSTQTDKSEIKQMKEIVEMPRVIYSGGLQKWQLIPEMQDAIYNNRDKCEYHLYVSNPDEFMKLWGDREIPKKWEVTTKTAEELKEAYGNAQYGFVLRDDIVVNKVACPTKIIDYIKYDIIPIMKTVHIGDFGQYGLEYLSVEDFLAERFPTEEERLEMCSKNRRIINKIFEEYQIGRNMVKKIIIEQNG